MGTFSARNSFFLPPESSAMATVVPSSRIATKEFATIIIERGGEEDPVIDHKLFGGKNAAPRGKSPKSKCQIAKHQVFIFYDRFEKRFLATGAGHTSSCTALRIIAVRIPFRNGTHKFGAVGGGKYASWRRKRGTSTAFRTIEYYCGKNSFPPSHL